MSLTAMHRRLVEVARQRVRTGEISERGLARRCSMSQPHMHNVLKNIRTLSTEFADRLIQARGISAADLLWSASGDQDVQITTVPVLRNRVGPGSETTLKSFRGLMPVPAALVAGLVDPVAIQLAPDLLLPGVLAANDLVLLDQNPLVRARTSGDGPWLIADEGGLRVRYLRKGGTVLYIVKGTAVEDPGEWRPLSLASRNVLDIVLGRIVWLGREVTERQADRERLTDFPGNSAVRPVPCRG